MIYTVMPRTAKSHERPGLLSDIFVRCIAWSQGGYERSWKDIDLALALTTYVIRLAK